LEAIFVERPVADVVLAVLDLPVAAVAGQDVGGGWFARRSGW
jgi:hypothetical protein